MQNHDSYSGWNAEKQVAYTADRVQWQCANCREPLYSFEHALAHLDRCPQAYIDAQTEQGDTLIAHALGVRWP